MNYLAHILFSSKSIDYQLGNLLADPLKAKVWQGASIEHRAGIKMHGLIDIFTDSHPSVKNSKMALAPEGHLRGVVLDVAYDHLLLKHWFEFVSVSADRFITHFYHQADSSRKNLPAPACNFLMKIIESDVLSSYMHLTNLKYVFDRIDTRLSARVLAKESTSIYFPELISNFNKIENGFLSFLPDLIHEFKQQSALDQHEYWLK